MLLQQSDIRLQCAACALAGARLLTSLWLRHVVPNGLHRRATAGDQSADRYITALNLFSNY